MADGDAQSWESFGELRKLVERARRCVGIEDAWGGADAVGELAVVGSGVPGNEKRTTARVHEV